MADTIFSTQFSEGAAKGKEIVAPGSLGRLGTDPAIQEALARQKDLSQGMNAQELQANREMMNKGINQAGQSQMRALQSQLGRAGVKGGIAGAQIRDVAMGTVQQKADVEKQLFAGDRAAREASLSTYLSNAANTAQFDIGQQSAEKNIELQSGMAFSSMGSAERSAALQAGAAERAAKLQADAQQGGNSSGLGGMITGGILGGGVGSVVGAVGGVFCFTGDTDIEMADGSYKKISLLELDDETSGGKVTATGKAYAFAPIYYYRGDYCTGSHIVFDNGLWRRVDTCEDAVLTLLDKTNIVYPLDTEKGFYYTKNGVKSHNFSEVEGSCSYEESLNELNRRHLESNVQGLLA